MSCSVFIEVVLTVWTLTGWVGRVGGYNTLRLSDRSGVGGAAVELYGTEVGHSLKNFNIQEFPFLYVRTPEGVLWHTASVCDFLRSTQKNFWVRFRPLGPRINQ